MSHSVDSDGTEPVGPPGLDECVTHGAGRKLIVTSPSHRFLPLRHAVHALAPRLGMCEAGSVRAVALSCMPLVAAAAAELVAAALARLFL